MKTETMDSETISNPQDNSSEQITQSAVSEFAKFNVSVELLKVIEKMGYTTPTPVQNSVIPVLMAGKTDLIALANTGTGKTGAFGIPLVERIDLEKKTQALIVCPTRELALQVATSIQGFGRAKGIRVASIVGGESYRKQFDVLRTHPHVIVSTPGRLIDLVEQGKVLFADVEYFVLDEADEMLSFGFKEALERIWEELEKSKNGFNTWLFSATMNPSIQRLTGRYLEKPKEFYLQKTQDSSRVESYAAVVYEEDKADALCLALLQTKDFYGIIFAQTKMQVDQLETKIRDCGFKVQSLHGDKTQAERTSTIKRLKSREFQILVATDVAARGLDIEDLTHVVNFDLPWDHETYTHRTGRTARAGKTGVVWNFCKPKDIRQMKTLERALKVQFKNLEIASADQVRHQMIESWLKTLASFQPAPLATADLKKSLEKIELEKPLNAETELWLARVLQHFKVGLPKNLKAPRIMDFTRLDDRPSYGGGGAGRDRRDDRRGGGGYDRRPPMRSPRFSGGGEGRTSDRSYGGARDSSERSNSWSESRPSFSPRAESSDRPQRNYDRGPSTGSDRPRPAARSFEGSSERRERPWSPRPPTRSGERTTPSMGGSADRRGTRFDYQRNTNAD